MSRPKILNTVNFEEYVFPGHAACHGCGSILALRHILKALGKNTILIVPAGCTSILAGLGKKATFNVPFLHMAFAAAAAAASGVRRALKIMNKEEINVVVWAGDGATFDIGFGTLSGAAERNEDIIYICNDNEAYMNTGIQKSGATPTGAWTATTVRGREGYKKDLFEIMVNHKIPYVATASPAYPIDLIAKVKKAMKIRGFRLIHVLNPCPTGWRFDHKLTIDIAKKAVLSGAWILMEAVNGKVKLNPPSSAMIKSRRISVKEYLMMQGRFRHLSEEDIEEIQNMVDNNWNMIRRQIT